MWQRLGIRTFILYIIKGFLPGLILFIFSLIILAAKNAILGNITGTINFQNLNISGIVVAAAGFLALIALPVIGFGILINIVRYFSLKYFLDADVLRVHKGIIGVDEISIPYSKIEDVNLDQSVLGRIFGIGEIYVITGGREEKGEPGETEAIFHMIDISKARYLQTELMSRGSVQKVKAV